MLFGPTLPWRLEGASKSSHPPGPLRVAVAILIPPKLPVFGPQSFLLRGLSCEIAFLESWTFYVRRYRRIVSTRVWSDTIASSPLSGNQTSTPQFTIHTMDARPFRPARPLAVPGNENMAPAKQIHHKHKSTGNLLQQQNQPVNGSLQVAAKRAAFGDRSNTARGILSRDDSSISTKAKGTTVVMPPPKPVAPVTGKENDGIRVVGKDAAKKETAVVPVARRNSHLNLPSKKATHLPGQPKRTTVYADPPRLDDAIENASSNLESLRGLVIPSSPEPTAVPTPEDEKPRPCHEKSGNNLPLGITHSDEGVAEPPYLDAVEELPVEVINYPVLEAKPLSLIPLSYLPDPEPAAKVSAKSVDFTALDLLSHIPDEDPAYISEPDEDLYDDQGYTTAHSVRDQDEPTALNDHTDPTRSSSTATLTVMFPPKLGKKGLAELEAAKGFVEAKRAYEDFDEDLWDISMVAEYSTEIFEYMRKMEIQLLPKSHYMDIQSEIQWSMRAVLMDWVIQVHGRFGLLPETLFLTANYIDRFLSVKVVSLGKLQLVGATALFIAAKYEEINCPSVQEIVYMVDGGYTIDEILKAERFMLTMLEFNLGWPGPMSFLRRISKADDYDLETRTLSKYFLEVALMDERFVASPPSYVAAGSHCLSRLILEKGDWTTEHVYYSSYTFDQLKPIVGMMLDCCRTAARHHAAVFEKYSDKRYKRAASYVQTELKNGFELAFQAPVRQAWQPCPPEDEKFSGLHFAPPAEYQQYKMPIPMQG